MTPAADAGATDAGSSKPAEVKTPKAVGPDAPAIIISSGLKGYTEPCGCTLDIMLGGIDRIVKFVNDSTELYPAAAMIDAGDLLFDRTEILEHELKQEKARVDLIVKGLNALPIEATVPGQRDFALGTEFYLETISKTKIAPLGANAKLNGKQLAGNKLIDLKGTKVFVVAAMDPTLFEGVEGVELGDADVALNAALKTAPKDAAIVLLGQGDLKWVKDRLKAHPQIDFGVVGHDPRETDQTDLVGNAFTLEPYDQGRYMGVLKLNLVGPGEIANARAASKADLEKIERQIEHVNSSIDRLPPATPGEESPMMVTLRERLDKLKAQRLELKNAKLETPADKNWFIWSSVPMEPEYAVDPEIEKARVEYNKSLKALVQAADRPIIPPEAGKPFFIGTDQCATCHVTQHEFWKKTSHGKAWSTLEERHKDFDQGCVGCHSVGYEKPGGSVVGKFVYDATLGDGPTKLEFTKDLTNVGCENCHGPGSMHRMQPVDGNGKPQHIKLEGPVETCQQCHVPEHSPRFNYDNYIKMITGEGHELRSK